jgi:hypothetical protein
MLTWNSMFRGNSYVYPHSRIDETPNATLTNSQEAPRHGSLAFLPRKRAARHRGKAKVRNREYMNESATEI